MAARPARHGAGLRFVLPFLAVFCTLQFALIRSEGTALERLLIDRATVGVAAYVLSFAYPEDGVRAAGYSIVSSRARLNVQRGCEGTELMFLAIAAALALPAAWPRRMAGLCLGLGLAYCLNQLRILALYSTLRYAPAHFELVHAYLAPTLLLCVLALLFWCWAEPAR